MGKTRKALKIAEERYRKLNDRVLKEALPKRVAIPSGKASAGKHNGRYGDLKNNLLARSFDGSIKTILFINTCTGDKSEDHAFKFSGSLAEDLGLKVLFIDLSLWTLSLQEVFRINYTLGLSDLFSHNDHMASRIQKVGPGNLYAMRLGKEHSGFLELFESGKFNQLLKNISDRFDFIILKAPETASFQECRMLCSKVDTVVLVLKPGTNSAQIILSEKNNKEHSADKLLGVVINKTKNYRHQFVKTASVFVAICLILTFGLLIRNDYLSVTSKTEKASIKSEKSSTPAQPKYRANENMLYDSDHDRVTEEKIKTETMVGRESIHESPKEINSPIDTAKEKSRTTQEVVPSQTADPILKPEEGSDENNRIQNTKERVVVVQRGETLFRIIYRNYGTYNDKIASLVLRKNPKILSPSHIVAGQSIKLPDINQLD
jgi:hypothetical protein